MSEQDNTAEIDAAEPEFAELRYILGFDDTSSLSFLEFEPVWWDAQEDLNQNSESPTGSADGQVWFGPQQRPHP